MSYGVLERRPVRIRIERTREANSAAYDSRVVAFRQQQVAASWTPGHLTMTRLSIAFVPRSSQFADGPFNLSMREIDSVEVAPFGRGQVVSLVTSNAVVHIRTRGAEALAAKLAGMAETARRQGATQRLRRS